MLVDHGSSAHHALRSSAALGAKPWVQRCEAVQHREGGGTTRCKLVDGSH